MDRKVFSLFILLSVCAYCSEKPPPPQTINISVPHQIDTLDPHAKDKLSNFAVFSNFYEPLVRTDANMRIQPCLASGWETRDANTWVFQLKESVKFHSGKEMTAEDVVYSYRRVMTNPQLEVQAYVSGIQEVRALDSRSILIRTEDPSPGLPNRLYFVMIVPEGSTSPKLAETVDGTGPYRLLSWEKKGIIRMSVNNEYWRKKLQPGIVHFYLNRTPDQAVQDALGGEFQLVQSRSRELHDRVREQDRLELLRRDSLFIKYLGFDMARDLTPYSSVNPNPFKMPEVRKAIHLAIDRQAFQDRLAASISPASQPIPPFVFGANPDIGPVRQDLPAARALMNQARLPDGFETTLHAREILKESAAVVREQLRQIGIRVEVRLLPDPEFFDAVRSGDASFFLSQFGCLTGDAVELQETLHTREMSGRYGSRNYGGYSNPEVDRLMEESRQFLSQEKRRRSIQKFLSILMEDLPWIPLYIDQDMYALDRSYSWNPRYDGFIMAEEIELIRD